MASLIALEARGVTHVVVHEEQFTGMFDRDRFNALAGRRIAPARGAGRGIMHRFR